MDDALKSSNFQARMLLQVHDELIFECPESELPALITLVRDKMENAVLLNVPLSVDLNSGRTWYDAK
jgi:DNA polymerase-1